MQIATSGVMIETMGQFQETEFSIGDPALFLEYLRKTIYSNPKKAICQELMCNARDAHREVGEADRPIRVKLPNKFNKTWECQDFGPGISPSRMKDVFVQFGKSTKRGHGKEATDNGKLQTGGFGIGAKTPWAYTDVFTIMTRAMEGKDLVERTYTAMIAEDRKNKLMEVAGSARVIDMNDTSIPEEVRHTGTTIIVDINPNDFSDFYRYTVQVAQFWDVKPVLSGADPLPAYPDWKYEYEGDGWKIGKNDGSYYRENYAIVDGVVYPLEYRSVEGMNDEQSSLIRSGVVLYFGVNEISVALSRESIQYDKPTQEAIKGKLDVIIADLKVRIADEIASAKNLWDAKVMWAKAAKTFSNASFIHSVPWKDANGVEHQVTRNGISKSNGVDLVTYDLDTSSAVTKIRRKESWDIRPSDSSILVLNDELTGLVSRAKLETLFDNGAGQITRIFVVKNNISDPGFVKWWKDNSMDQYGAIRLSTVAKKIHPKAVKTVGPNGTIIASRNKNLLKVWQFDRSYHRWNETELDTSDKAEVVWVEWSRGSADGISNSDINRQVEVLKATTGNDITVYGVPNRYTSKVGSTWISLKALVKREYDKRVKATTLQDIIDVVEGEEFTVTNHSRCSSHMTSPEFTSLLTDKTGLLSRWIAESNRVAALKAKYEKTALFKLAAIAGKEIYTKGSTGKTPTIKVMHDTFEDVYPLVKAFSRWQVSNVPVADLAFYFNSVDFARAAATTHASAGQDVTAVEEESRELAEVSA